MNQAVFQSEYRKSVGFFFRFFSLFRGLFRQLANKLASPFVHQAQVCTEVDSLNLRRLAIQFHQS